MIYHLYTPHTNVIVVKLIVLLHYTGFSLGLEVDNSLSGDELDKMDPVNCKDVINKVWS